jgi:hypothetical protein
MATFELYRRSTIGMCLTETLDEMVSNGTLSPELAIQVLVQFDKVEMPRAPPFFPCLGLWGNLVIDCFAPLCCSSSP